MAAHADVDGHDAPTKPALKKRKRAPKQAAVDSAFASTLGSLQNTQIEQTKRWALAKRTSEAYSGYVKRGKEFLKQLIANSRTAGEVLTDKYGDPINEDDFKNVFDDPPNQYSAEALMMYLSEECHKLGKGKSTAQALYSAFKKHWETM